MKEGSFQSRQRSPSIFLSRTWARSARVPHRLRPDRCWIAHTAFVCTDSWEDVHMYAVIRKLAYDQTRLAQGGQQQLAAFRAIHERQPGFRGSMVIQADNGN